MFASFAKTADVPDDDIALQIPSARYPSRAFAMSRFFAATIGLLLAVSLRAQSSTPPEATPPQPSPSATPLTLSSVHLDAPIIALTFDDGPSDKLTPQLLDLLARHHIKATFFVVGENAAEYPEILRRAVREGHEIGNHSWSHPDFAKMSDEGVRREIKRTEEAITDAIGTRPTLLRPPYGAVTTRQKHFIHDELGYEIILWDVDPLDWKKPGPSVVSNRILKETRPGSIVLAHDIHASTIKAMPETLNQLEEKGFKFVTVSELIRLAKSQPPKPAPVAAAVAASPPMPGTAPSPHR